jgi:hypothetical protein
VDGLTDEEYLELVHFSKRLDKLTLKANGHHVANLPIPLASLTSAWSLLNHGGKLVCSNAGVFLLAL